MLQNHRIVWVVKCVFQSNIFEKEMLVTGEDSRRFSIATSPVLLLAVFEITV